MGELFGWLFAHGLTVGWLSLGLALLVLLPLALVYAGLRWYFFGAKVLVAGWVWHRAWRALSSRTRHRGGAGGARTYSAEYQAVMRSPGWRRRRAQAIRRAGRRCQECGGGGPLDVHHLSYAHLGAERPYELAVLCEACHARVHRRSAVSLV